MLLCGKSKYGLCSLEGFCHCVACLIVVSLPNRSTCLLPNFEWLARDAEWCCVLQFMELNLACWVILPKKLLLQTDWLIDIDHSIYMLSLKYCCGPTTILMGFNLFQLSINSPLFPCKECADDPTNGRHGAVGVTVWAKSPWIHEFDVNCNRLSIDCNDCHGLIMFDSLFPIDH